MLDVDKIEKFVQDAVIHYEKSAPETAAYLDDLYVRIQEQAEDVSLRELMLVNRLMTESGWMDPHYAQNHITHVLSFLGRPTPMISF